MTRDLKRRIAPLVDNILTLAEGYLAMRERDLGGEGMVSDAERRETYRALGIAFFDRAIERFETAQPRKGRSK
jgi:hypothetical protein